MQPYHQLRHPLVFYYGHPATLYINKLRVAGVIKTASHIDALEPHAPTEKATPSVVLLFPNPQLFIAAIPLDRRAAGLAGSRRAYQSALRDSLRDWCR